MIFISLKTTRILTLNQEVELKNNITVLINKYMHAKVIIQIEDNQLIYYNNKEIDTMIIKCYVYKDLENDFKKKIRNEIMKIVEETSEIDIEYQCVILNGKIQ